MKIQRFQLAVFVPIFLSVGLFTVVMSAQAEATRERQDRHDEKKDESGESQGIDIVRELIECFNRHDPKAMTALMHDDCEISYVSEDGKSQLSANKAADIEKEMAQYFQYLPTVKSEIRQAMQAGNFVTVEEYVEWTAGETMRSQASLGVFEVVDGKIRRVWYYPAYR